MKEEMRIAGLFGSFAFLVVVAGGLYATKNPMQSLLYGVATAMLVGMIGHRMGYILSHPENKHKKQAKNQPARGSTASDSLDFKPLTGEETFLDDLPL